MPKKSERKRGGRPALPREHGTERGYQQHRHRKEAACTECLDAHAQNNRKEK